MSNTKIISICNRKGGTGKTNIAINLASYLSYFGKKVLLIDLDPQANATSGLGAEDKNKRGIYEVLSHQIPMIDSVRQVRENLWFIPSHDDLAGAEIELINIEKREFRLAEILNSFLNENKLKGGQEIDFVFLDTPPSLGLITLNSLVASDNVLIPVQAEYYALEGLSQLVQTINLVKENLHPNLDILGAVLTMYDRRNKLSFEIWQELYKHFPYKIFRTVIPRNVALAEAPSYGKTILEYAPNSKGSNAYKRLAKELLFHHSQILNHKS